MLISNYQVKRNQGLWWIKILYCHYHESHRPVFQIASSEIHNMLVHKLSKQHRSLIIKNAVTRIWTHNPPHVNALPNGLVCIPNTLYQRYIGWCSSVIFISWYFCNTHGRWTFITSKQGVAKTITIQLSVF